MLERLDTKSIPSILDRITAELKVKLPESGAFENFRYVYEILHHCTPRILFEFICLGSDEQGYTCGVMLGGVFPEPPLRKISQHLLAGGRMEIIAYFQSPDAPQKVLAAIEKLDTTIRFHD